jgi:hypothetical protein
MKFVNWLGLVIRGVSESLFPFIFDHLSTLSLDHYSFNQEVYIGVSRSRSASQYRRHDFHLCYCYWHIVLLMPDTNLIEYLMRAVDMVTCCISSTV